MVQEAKQEAELERIVRRHAGWLHASARRRVGDPALADDVTQAVFILLWQKRPDLANEGQLVAWLHRAAGYCAANARKLQTIRARREKEAAMRRQQDSQPQGEAISGELDAAVSRLGAKDRQAILLRFSREMDYAHVGEAMGISPNAARMRVERALEKLHGMLAGKTAAPAQGSIVALLGAADAPGQWLAQTVAAVRGENPSGSVAELLNSVRSAERVRAGMAGGALAVAAVIALIIPLANAVNRSAPAARPAGAKPKSVQTVEAQVAPRGLPMQPGFPIAVPGAIVAAPSVGDLDGDGKLEILVSCMERQSDGALAHTSPDPACQVFALRLDGKVLPGWPAVLRDRSEREGVRLLKPGYSENWASSPSTADLDGDGKDEVVVVASQGSEAATYVLRGDGAVMQTLAHGDAWVSVPIADVDGDQTLDLMLGAVIASWDGVDLPGWNRGVRGFAPCVGDANGDGALELYLPTMIHLGEIQGLDRLGNMLPGWPKKVGRQCLFSPVMGDVDGDGKMEIVAADQGGHILAWKWDGAALPGTQTDGHIDGVFKSISASGASPTLADLDGDGIAEIVVFNGTLYAWRGNGEGVYRPDGVIANVGRTGRAGVTVADLGGDGVMDFFAGGRWIKVSRDGQVSITPLLPEGAMCATQVTICDLDGDALAELLYSSADGQLFAYRTEMAYAERLMEWPTPSRDFRHTGAWVKGGLEPRKSAGKRGGQNP